MKVYLVLFDRDMGEFDIPVLDSVWSTKEKAEDRQKEILTVPYRHDPWIEEIDLDALTEDGVDVEGLKKQWSFSRSRRT